MVVRRLLSPLVTTTATWVWVWNAPKRWPQPSVEPSFWPSCPSSPSGEVTGVTRSVNPIPCPARLPDAAVPSWCVSFLRPVVPALCLHLCPRSCLWWPELTTATHRPGAALPPSATSVGHVHFAYPLNFSPCSAQLHLHSGVVVVIRRDINEYCNARQIDFADSLFCSPFSTLQFLLVAYVRHLKLKHLLLISAKATFDAISKTYSYLTPDLWKETVFTKSPYQVRFNHNFISWLVIWDFCSINVDVFQFQEFTDHLAKTHTRVSVQRGQTVQAAPS